MVDAQVLLAAVLGMLIATTGVVIGYQAGRHSVAPRRRGYDPDGVGEATVEIRTSAPESEEVAAELAGEPEPEEPPDLPKDFGTGYWPVADTQRLDLLDGETVRIRVPGARVDGAPATEAPWAWLTRNGNPDKDRACLTRTQEQRKLDGVSG